MVWISQWLDSLNTTEIVAWGVDKVAGGVIVGVIIVVITTIITVNYIEKKREARRIKREDEIEARRIKREEESKQMEKLEQERDKERIYNWLYNKTKEFGYHLLGEPNNPRWISTIDISRHTHLPTDRVKEICTKHEGIVLMGKEDLWPNETLEEKWAIKKLVKQS